MHPTPVPAPLPEKIGPYRVVTRLASGGMSEIFLAIRRGAAGFERPVAVKRMLPHLTAQPEVSASIVDESRIVSRLRHPNVVSVEDLGLDGASYYIVLEYLRGESLAGLIRRLRARGERLEPALGTYVIAEVCAGLHAAHELADDDGTPLNVVHRDVSPHNVFLTFEGEVKVIDFGIARFQNRASERTKTGIAKGKFAYMAPEQFTGEPLDRRADVFSVGTLMHELLTGERLFARDSDMQSLKAILHDPIAAPSERWPAIPASLDGVCLRALARSREERFPTADALRTAVRELLPVVDPGQHARDRLTVLMRRVLADQWTETEDLLRRSRERSATRPTSIRPQSETAPTASRSSPAGVPPASPVPPPPPSTPELVISVDEDTPKLRPVPRSVARGRARPVLLAIAVGLAAIALAVLGRPRGQVEITGTAVPPVDAPSVVAPPEPVVDPVPAALPEPVPPAVPEPPATVHVHLETIPPGAEVRLGERLVGVTPFALELPRDSAAVELTIARPGYAPAREIVVPDADARVRIQLMRVREPRGRRGARFYSFD